MIRTRRTLGAAIACVLAALASWFFVRTRGAQGFSNPSAAMQPADALRQGQEGQGAAAEERASSSRTSDGAPAAAREVAPPSAASSSQSEREAAPLPADLRAAARDYLAVLEAARPDVAVPQDAASDSLASVGDALDPWRDSMHAKYAGHDAEELARSRRLLERILEWQEHGPFESDAERFEKRQLEALMREVEWLREAG